MSGRILTSMTSTSMRLFSFFFFSSRRRHTRLQGDWSSDVCSSDLNRKIFFPEASPQERVRSNGFDRPILHSAVRALRVHVNPSVGIHPFHLRECTCQRDRLLFVEFRRK